MRAQCPRVLRDVGIVLLGTRAYDGRTMHRGILSVSRDGIPRGRKVSPDVFFRSDFARSNRPRFMNELKALSASQCEHDPRREQPDNPPPPFQKASRFVRRKCAASAWSTSNSSPPKASAIYADWLPAAGKPTRPLLCPLRRAARRTTRRMDRSPFEPTERNKICMIGDAVETKANCGWK